MWHLVRDFPIYEVSHRGEVRNTKTNKLLKPTVKFNGYCQVGLSNETEKNKKKYVHVLVTEAFIGDLNWPRVQCNHIDGNKQNNNLSNLEIVNPKQNVKHSFNMGRVASNRKLTPEQVIEVRYLLENFWEFNKPGKSIVSIAKKFEVSPGTIYHIKNNLTYQ